LRLICCIVDVIGGMISCLYYILLSYGTGIKIMLIWCQCLCTTDYWHSIHCNHWVHIINVCEYVIHQCEYHRCKKNAEIKL